MGIMAYSVTNNILIGGIWLPTANMPICISVGVQVHHHRQQNIAFRINIIINVISITIWKNKSLPMTQVLPYDMFHSKEENYFLDQYVGEPR